MPRHDGTTRRPTRARRRELYRQAQAAQARKEANKSKKGPRK